MDTPPRTDNDLEDKDESYFDEIRNFIGKATEGDKSITKENYESIDANFSITAQIEKKIQLEADEKKENGDEDDMSPAKKPKLDNNNHESSLTNGYHDDESGNIHSIHKSSLNGVHPVLTCST